METLTIFCITVIASVVAASGLIIRSDVVKRGRKQAAE